MKNKTVRPAQEEIVRGIYYKIEPARQCKEEGMNGEGIYYFRWNCAFAPPCSVRQGWVQWNGISNAPLTHKTILIGSAPSGGQG